MHATYAAGEASLDQVAKVVAAVKAKQPKNVAASLSGALRQFDPDSIGAINITDLSHVRATRPIVL